jgi:hypothetical protein
VGNVMLKQKIDIACRRRQNGMFWRRLDQALMVGLALRIGVRLAL